MSQERVPTVDGDTTSEATAGAAPRTSTGRPRHLAPLLSLLRREPTAFSFFQAVRTLERLHPERADVGRFVDPAREVVRFTVNPSISFPPAEVAGLDLPEDGPARMSVNFFGLTGPQGVLPHQYTLLLADRLRARDTGPAAFLDMFHHRMISLFYRAWQKNRVTVCYEKGSDDRLSEHLLDLIGEGLDAQRAGITPLQRRLLFYVGLLAPQARGASSLQQLLEDVFDVPVEVEQFVGGWYPLPERDQCMLGEERGLSTQLGLGSVAGDEVWDQQTRVRVRMGPLSTAQYADFLPTGSAHELLRWLVRFFSRDAFDFELQLVLTREEVPGFVLGEETGPQPLGWATWIRTKPLARDPDETILRL